MSIDKERMALRQTSTAKLAKVLPWKKALRHAQTESRVDNKLNNRLYGLIRLAPANQLPPHRSGYFEHMMMKTGSLVGLAAVAAVALLGTAGSARSQTTSAHDDTQQIIAELQTNKRAVVLKNLGLTDDQVTKFTPIYDEYQSEMKDQYQAGADLINKYASNYDSMTDDAAKGMLKEGFRLRKNRTALLEKYAGRLSRAGLPETKVLRFVQIENKLNTLIDLEAARTIPLVP